MKLSKKAIVIGLVLCLALLSFVPATFSWYDHNGSLTGNSMSYERVDLPVSAGVITIETKRYNTEREHNAKNNLDGGDSNKLYYDVKGNKEYGDDINGGGTIPAGTTQYFGTTFTNEGTAPAYVNLYLKEYANEPQNIIGTLQPSLTEKGVSSSVHLANKNVTRVYFQWKDTNNWSDSNAKRYVVYTTKNGSKDSIEIKENETFSGKIDNTKDTNNILKGVATYYADLPEQTTEFFFATDGANSGFNEGTLAVTQPWYRTRTITNVQPEMGYYLTGVADDTTFNAQYATFAIPGGISVMTYFDTATMASGQHAYVTLNEGTNYTGVKATYVSDNNNVTVNGNTGYVTASTVGHNLNATITTTITGSLGDTMTVQTTVTNPEKINAQVALNVEVPGKTTNKNGDEVNGTAEIVWYIDNSKGSGGVSFDSVYYTK